MIHSFRIRTVFTIVLLASLVLCTEPAFNYTGSDDDGDNPILHEIRREAQEWFELFDEDVDDVLAARELQALLNSEFGHATLTRLESIMIVLVFDANDNNAMDLDELLQLMIAQTQVYTGTDVFYKINLKEQEVTLTGSCLGRKQIDVELVDGFDAMDRNGDGCIGFYELIALLKDIGIAVAEYDNDLARKVGKRYEKDNSVPIPKAFAYFDRNRNQRISKDEFGVRFRLLKANGKSKTLKEFVTQLTDDTSASAGSNMTFDLIDTNNDGILSVQEFTLLIKKYRIGDESKFVQWVDILCTDPIVFPQSTKVPKTWLDWFNLLDMDLDGFITEVELDIMESFKNLMVGDCTTGDDSTYCVELGDLNGDNQVSLFEFMLPNKK